MSPELQGILFALVAGACTAVGGGVIFFVPPSKNVVAGGMAAAAGVMLFVTLAEVFAEAKHYFRMSFIGGSKTEAYAMASATAALVGGWLFADALGALVNLALPKQKELREGDSIVPDTEADARNANSPEGIEIMKEDEAERRFNLEHRQFLRSGIFTTIALGLHNLPEGIATYTGSLADSRLGIGMAVAIGAHNIPEGIAVAIPLHHATSNKWLAFGYAAATGIAEPIGALIAFGFMRKDTPPLVLAIAFGIVAGIMLNIALKELLIMAVLFDPLKRVVPHCFAAGMLFIALSLVLLDFASAA